MGLLLALCPGFLEACCEFGFPCALEAIDDFLELRVRIVGFDVRQKGNHLPLFLCRQLFQKLSKYFRILAGVIRRQLLQGTGGVGFVVRIFAQP